MAFGEIADREVLASTDIDVGQHRLRVANVSFVIQFHDMQACFRHVIDIEEFTHRRTGAPDQNFRSRALLRLVKTSEQSRYDVAIFG